MLLTAAWGRGSSTRPSPVTSHWATPGRKTTEKMIRVQLGDFQQRNDQDGKGGEGPPQKRKILRQESRDRRVAPPTPQVEETWIPQRGLNPAWLQHWADLERERAFCWDPLLSAAHGNMPAGLAPPAPKLLQWTVPARDGHHLVMKSTSYENSQTGMESWLCHLLATSDFLSLLAGGSRGIALISCEVLCTELSTQCWVHRAK